MFTFLVVLIYLLGGSLLAAGIVFTVAWIWNFCLNFRAYLRLRRKSRHERSARYA